MQLQFARPCYHGVAEVIMSLRGIGHGHVRLSCIMYDDLIVQGRHNRSGFGRTIISQGKNKIEVLRVT